MTTLASVLDSSKVVVCLGSGGVGKTTAAAALGMALASSGENVVVLTIDPAKRLADALGQAGELDNEPTVVKPPGRPWKGCLWAAMLDPAATLETVIRADAQDDASAERLLANPLLARLAQSLSGTNEYMAVERLYQLVNDDRFDRVVIDTPPSRHAFDFLDSPRRLVRFVDHRLYRSVFAPNAGLFGTVKAGGRLMLRFIGRLVGSDLVDNLIEFFGEFEGLDNGFRNRAEAIDQLLSGDETAYVLVTAPRAEPVAEGEWMVANLAERQRSVRAIVVNRVLPIDLSINVEKLTDDDPLHINYRELAALASGEADLVEEMIASTTQNADSPDQTDDKPPPAALVVLHEQQRPVASIAQLRKLATELEKSLR